MNGIIYKKINKEIQKAWDSLWNQSEYANNTNSFQWFQSTVDAFGYKEYAIVAVYKKDALIGIVGLVKEKIYGVPVYTVAPYDFLCGTPFLLDLDDTEAVKTFTTTLLTLGNVFFNNVPESAATLLQKNTDSIDTKRKTINYYLPLVKDAQGSVRLENRKKFLRDCHTIEDKLTVKNFDGQKEEGLTIAFTIDEQSRKEKRGYSVFANPQIKQFYQALLTHFQKHLRINILYFEKAPIAYEIGFLIGKNYFGSQMSFIAEYGKYSPGKVLLVNVIDYVASLGVTTMDFGSGDSRIKQLLTREHRFLYQVMISKNKLARTYITSLGQTKEYLFNKIRQYVKLYAAYRKIKKVTKR
jgi:GNAT acetyltransferase-like protein